MLRKVMSDPILGPPGHQSNVFTPAIKRNITANVSSYSGNEIEVGNIMSNGSGKGERYTKKGIMV